MEQTLREKLHSAYKSFTEKFGFLNLQKNKKVILTDKLGFEICSSLELKIGDKLYKLSDVLTKDPDEIEQFTTESSIDGLSWVLGMYGTVRMDILQEVTGKEESDLIMELGDVLYWEPEMECWCTSDKYLSGNIYVKMRTAQRILDTISPEDPIYYQIERSYNAIKEVMPDQIPFSLLIDHINCGERWIDISWYREFAEWLFDVNDSTQLTICYLNATDTYKVDSKYRWNYPKLRNEYAVTPKGARNNTLYGDGLLEHALQNTAPYFTYTDGLGNKIADTDAIQLAADKIETIRQKFTEWLQLLPADRKDQIVDKYNNLYNCYVIRKYNGSHMRFPGLDMKGLQQVFGITKLHDSQRDTAWRIIQDNGCIVDHQVGSGKSLICVMAAHEMKRMKIRNKPCILCLKANVGDLVKLYRTAYPSARVLAPSEQDFEKKNRVRLFYEMQNNDWDCVIMTHDQFGKIPQSPEIQREIIQEEVDNLQRDMEAVKDMGHQVSRTMLKGLEQRKATLEVKLKIVLDRIASGKDEVDFDSIGIDHLLIDEAHKFKNLCFTTRHDRVAGLGNTAGSQKAMNMLFAIRNLQKRFNSDLQATFLSGTPISNSLTELYLLFKYLRPNELARQNIMNFDSWAAVFAKKSTDYEFSVTNQIQAKERFRHFIKVPELALFYNEIADYRTNKSINIDKPETTEELVHLPATEDQQSFIQNLICYAKTGDGSYIGREDLYPGCGADSARMLIATNYAKKMSTDMRLINSMIYDDDPGNKVSVCCSKVSEFYYKFKERKGTQIIFCDLGVPDKEKWNVYDEIRKKLTEEFEIPTVEIAFIHSYNERTRSKLFKQINDGDVRILVASTDKGGTGVNVQERVVAIHDLDIPWKPAELEQRGGRGARQGNWLAKLHQDNIVYRYIYAVEKSLDTYKFTLLKNKQTFISQMKTNELQVRSIDEGSFDEATGMNFAEYVAILSGDNTLLEKAKVDKKLALLENLRTVYYREQHNNKYLLEHKISRKIEVDEYVMCLQRDSEQYNRLLQRDETGTRLNPIVIYALTEERKLLDEQRKKAIEQKQKEREEVRRTRWVAKMDTMASKRAKQEGYDVQVVEDAGVEEQPEIETNEPIVVDIPEDGVVVGQHLVSIWQKWVPKIGETCEVIGELLGFNLYIERASRDMDEMRSVQGTNILFTNKLYARNKEGGPKYVFNHGIPHRDGNYKLAARHYINSLEKCDNQLKQYTEEQQRLQVDVKHYESMEVKPFNRDEEIILLREESKKLDRQISESIGKVKHETVEL